MHCLYDTRPSRGTVPRLGSVPSTSQRPNGARWLCAIFVLPTKPSAATKDLVKATAAKFKASRGLHVVYVHEKDQGRVLSKLQAPRAPTLLVVRGKPKTVRVGVLTGTLNEASVAATLERAIGGDLPMQAYPASVMDFK